MICNQAQSEVHSGGIGVLEVSCNQAQSEVHAGGIGALEVSGEENCRRAGAS